MRITQFDIWLADMWPAKGIEVGKICPVFLSVLLMTIACCDAQAQFKKRFRHSVGASAHILPIADRGLSVPFGVFYNPQFNILNRYTDFSVAATMPVTIGAHVKNAVIPRSYFYAHLPAVAEVNIGHFATRRFRNDIGLGLGAGYAAQINGADVGTGPVFTAAARAWVGVFSLTLRYAFHYNVTGLGYDTHNLTVAVNLGSFFKSLRADNALEKWQRPR